MKRAAAATKIMGESGRYGESRVDPRNIHTMKEANTTPYGSEECAALDRVGAHRKTNKYIEDS